MPQTASYLVTKYEEHVLMRANLPSDTVLVIEEEFICFRVAANVLLRSMKFQNKKWDEIEN